MTKRFLEIGDCHGMHVVAEIDKNGVVFRGYDPDVEEAAQALGLEPSPCAEILEDADTADINLVLMEWLDAGRSADWIALALALGADPNYKRVYQDNSPLILAILEEGDAPSPDRVEVLLEAGAHIGPPEIHRAAAYAGVPVLRLLIKHGAKTEHLDQHAIKAAAKTNSPDVVAFLIDHGARPWVHEAEIFRSMFKGMGSGGRSPQDTARIVEILLNTHRFPKHSIATGYGSAALAGNKLAEAVFEDYICEHMLGDEDK
jgi:hypothetical protein